MQTIATGRADATAAPRAWNAAERSSMQWRMVYLPLRAKAITSGALRVPGEIMISRTP